MNFALKFFEKFLIRILMMLNINNYNFGFIKYSDKNQYLLLYEKAKKNISNEVLEYENNNGFKINDEYISNLALHTQVVIKKSPINFNHGKVLYTALCRYININKNHFLKENINIIETGTARGFSSICMSKAIIDSNIKGNIYSIDILPHNKKMYWNVIDDFESKKTRKELISFWHKELENIIFFESKSLKILPNLNIERINFAFLDSSHEYKVVQKEFEIIRKKQKKGDLIVFDDYSPNKYNGVVKVVDDIAKNNFYKTNFLDINNNRMLVICEKA